MGLDTVCVYLSVNAVRALGMKDFCLVQGVHDCKCKVNSWHTVHVLTTHSDAYCHTTQTEVD